MTTEFMKDLLSKDEKITVEYKTCQYGIQEDDMKRYVLFLTDMADISSWGRKMMGRQ